MSHKPCDNPPFNCPFGAEDAVSSYFCRDHCGEGVVEEEPDIEVE